MVVLPTIPVGGRLWFTELGELGPGGYLAVAVLERGDRRCRGALTTTG